ncbi:hypothetical protein H6G76_19425 [Nostoc sp. FACHB-152]|uniref:COG1470 family protein n=1 Tax=Nostoc sp. FACHB-152 TaxID=2692837 RepID=UPI001685FCE2|nr:hypothetical protein [Nostoc sp. FACHB-152]MBD2449289.1 hypothetical protein [Nostoc sp. FACHB-152]
MPNQASPLQIILNPPGIQFGMPGDTIKLYVVVINQGTQSAVVELSFIFDDEFKNLTGWSSPPQASLGIAPQQSSDEVQFELQIPVDALPGTYDYTLVVDAPQHYPQDTPINFPLQLKVLLKEQTVIRANDPTFAIKPSSNTNKALLFNANENSLSVEVTVDNRSNRVDRFHLTCPDLDEDWFTIIYPTTGFEGVGLSEVAALGLNPASQGKILLTFHPPRDTLAGIYSPTIRLHSENFPDLVLLDLVYIQIPTIYRLDVSVQTILAQVSRSPAKYELLLVNQGNVVRELTFNLESRDEEALYTYKFQPSEIRLLPSKTSSVYLTVTPRPWWRRPWLGGGLVINFQPNIHDTHNLPVANTLTQLSFVWKPRPLWQFLLLLLVGIGLLGGIGFIVWRLLHPDPVKLDNFAANSSQIIEGQEVTLGWQIQNYQNLQKLELTVKGQQPVKSTIYDFKNGIPEELVKSCVTEQRKKLTCRNVNTGATTKGKYNFELKGFYRQGLPLFSQVAQTEAPSVQVEVSEKPIAQVIGIKTDKLQYGKGDRINLSWQIANFLLLREVQVTGNAEDGTLISQPFIYKFNQGAIADPQLQKQCREIQDKNQLECQNISIPALKAGKYTFQIKALSNNGSDRNSAKKTESTIEILPKPFRIVSFTLNGSEQPNQELKEGTTATLSWRVEGEDIQVKLEPFGDVPPIGSKELRVNQALPSPIKLQVTDKSGKQTPQDRAFAIAVIKPPQPTPTLPIPIPQVTPALPSR